MAIMSENGVILMLDKDEYYCKVFVNKDIQRYNNGCQVIAACDFEDDLPKYSEKL